MRFASLGSGSSGNALLVEVKQTRVLLDCGFGLRDSIRRLARLEIAPQDLSGILVTHEHSDHIGGVARLARKFNLPVWLTHGTHTMWQSLADSLPTALHTIDSHHRFHIGDIEIEPFPVPHDAREPVQYVLGDGARRLGVLTDVGCSTPHIEATLSHCDALVLECNHDRDMLLKSNYPSSLKKRVGGRFGHLDNNASAALLARLARGRLQHVVAAHLSRENNTPELAREALGGALNCAAEWVGVADQEEGFDWRQIT
jgi:phosphoribosyl 1,2-cyclic phosphodiesterase